MTAQTSAHDIKSVILSVIQSASRPMDTPALIEETGFESSQISNALYALYRDGLIDRIGQSRAKTKDGKEGRRIWLYAPVDQDAVERKRLLSVLEADMAATEATSLTDLDLGLIALRDQFNCRRLDPRMASDARKIAETLLDIGAVAVAARQHEIADALEELTR